MFCWGRIILDSANQSRLFDENGQGLADLDLQVSKAVLGSSKPFTLSPEAVENLKVRRESPAGHDGEKKFAICRKKYEAGRKGKKYGDGSKTGAQISSYFLQSKGTPSSSTCPPEFCTNSVNVRKALEFFQ